MRKSIVSCDECGADDRSNIIVEIKGFIFTSPNGTQIIASAGPSADSPAYCQWCFNKKVGWQIVPRASLMNADSVPKTSNCDNPDCRCGR